MVSLKPSRKSRQAFFAISKPCEPPGPQPHQNPDGPQAAGLLAGLPHASSEEGGGARPASAGAAASRKLRGTGANWQGLEHRKGHHPGYAAARPSRGPSGVDAQTCLPFGLRTQGGGGGREGGGGGGNETMPTLLLTCNDGVDKGVPHSMRWTGERHIDVPP